MSQNIRSKPLKSKQCSEITSLKGFCKALFSFRVCEGVNKISESSVSVQKLLIRASLRDLPVHQNQDQIRLRQKAHPVSHQNPRLPNNFTLDDGIVEDENDA